MYSSISEGANVLLLVHYDWWSFIVRNWYTLHNMTECIWHDILYISCWFKLIIITWWRTAQKASNFKAVFVGLIFNVKQGVVSRGKSSIRVLHRDFQFLTASGCQHMDVVITEPVLHTRISKASSVVGPVSVEVHLTCLSSLERLGNILWEQNIFEYLLSFMV